MKKVLQIATTTLQHDGLTKVIFSLIDNVPAGLTKQYIVLGKGALPEYEKMLAEKRVRVFRVPDRENNLKAYLTALKKILKKYQFDIVHVHGNSCTMALDLLPAAVCGVKIRISHCHNTATKHPIVHNSLKPVLNALTTTPVACGNDAGKFLFYKKFTVVPNCIEVDKFRFNESVRERVRKELKCGDDFLIGHVGRFSYQKNHTFLIDIFHALLKKEPHSKLLLIGEGELLDQVKTKVKALKIEDKVIFYGVTDKVNELMQAMDLFLFPSNFEGLGITAIEAQAAGLPVLASNQVPTEAKVATDFKRLSLNRSSDIWADTAKKLLNLASNRSQKYLDVIKNGYDIEKMPGVIKKIWQL